MKKTLMLIALNVIFTGTLLNAERYNCPGPGNIECKREAGSGSYTCTSGSKWFSEAVIYTNDDINKVQFDFIDLKGDCPKQSGGECIVTGCRYSVTYKGSQLAELVLEPDVVYNNEGYCKAPSLDFSFMDCDLSAKKL